MSRKYEDKKIISNVASGLTCDVCGYFEALPKELSIAQFERNGKWINISLYLEDYTNANCNIPRHACSKECFKKYVFQKHQWIDDSEKDYIQCYIPIHYLKEILK